MATLDKALAPLADGLDGRLLLARYLTVETACCTSKHDARAPRQGLRDRAPSCPPLQRLLLFGRQLKRLDRPANPSLCHRHVSYDGARADGFKIVAEVMDSGH